MLSRQNTSPLTVTEMLRRGVTPNQWGHPQPWDALIREPSKGDLKNTAWLLANIDKLKAEGFLARLAHREQWAIAAFLDSLKIAYFFVGSDDERGALLQRCGPDRTAVLNLLKTRPRSAGHESATQDEDTDQLDRIWQAVKILADELKSIDGVSFSLLWDGHGAATPEFDFSIDRTRQYAWDFLWKTLPIEARRGVPLKPPPRPFELEVQRIDPAVPSALESGIQEIAWPDFQRHNIDRSLDWRWCRAFSLVRNDRDFNSKWDDTETGSAVEFLRALFRTPQDPASLAEKMPSFQSAHQIRTGPIDLRLELEARLLARQSSEEIAERLSVSATAVDAYHDAFFDVRDRLESKTYVVKKVIGVNSGFGFGSPTLEGLTKQVAYFAGPTVLDVVLPYLKENGRKLAEHTATDENPVHDPIAERIDLLLRAQSLPSDSKTSASLVKVAGDLIQNFPENRPTQRWTGVFAQIVSPFEGEFTSTVGELQAGSIVDRQAA